jgi:predicted RNA-binding Zn ribbon-like protein
MLGALSLEFTALPLDRRDDFAASLVRLDVLSHPPLVRHEDLSAAVTLRDALQNCFGAACDGTALSARSVETVNSFAADEPPLVQLTAHVTVVRAATDPVRCALAAIARDGILVAGLRRERLRRCAACHAFFLDDSRGGRRRWCSMERCGNRAKVAGYRSRRQR